MQLLTKFMAFFAMFGRCARAERHLQSATKYLHQGWANKANGLLTKAYRLSRRAQDADITVRCLLGMAAVQRELNNDAAESKLLNAAVLKATTELSAEHPVYEQALTAQAEQPERLCASQVRSQLKVIRMSHRLLSRMKNTGDEPGMESKLEERHGYVLDLIVSKVGHRHWLTALLYASMAEHLMNAGSSERAAKLLRHGRQIALEFNERGAEALQYIEALETRI